MTASRSITLTLATSALAFTSPALAHQDASGAVFQSNPVIQPLPVLDSPPPPAPPPPPPPPAPEPVEIYEEEAYAAPPTRSGHAQAYPEHYQQAPYPGAYPGQYPYPMAQHSAPQHFDREAWLTDCRERIRGIDRKDRGGVIGGLLGAVAGGVIGNRAWGSERLAGTLLGAGVGGLAGIAIGAAVGAAGERRREDECAWHLDRHMASFPQGPAYGYPGTGYGYGYGYPAVAYVPVLVQIPQRAIVREYVTEEWVDRPARAETITKTTVVRQPTPAPRAGKRIKLIKGK